MNFGKLNLESKGDLLATQTINQQAKQSLSQTQRFDRNQNDMKSVLKQPIMT